MKDSEIWYLSANVQRACKRLDSANAAERSQARDYLKRQIKHLQTSLDSLNNTDGGPGSGNWGHTGRPGKRGGSGSGGGKMNRLSTPNGGYTSRSQAEAENRIWNRAHGTGGDYEGGTPEDYLKERMKSTQKKKWDKYTQDKMLRGPTGEVWQKLDWQSKMSLFRYTKFGYKYINGGLRDGKFENEQAKTDTINMTNAISQCRLPEDMMFSRDVGLNGLSKFLGISKDSLTPKNIHNLIGKSGTDDGFMSCAAGKMGRFDDDKPVRLHVFAPKGAQAMYMEPFSAHGASGEDQYWDGKSKQYDMSGECEVLFQRGTSCEVTGAEYKRGIYEIYVMVTGQEYGEIPS